MFCKTGGRIVLDNDGGKDVTPDRAAAPPIFSRAVNFYFICASFDGAEVSKQETKKRIHSAANAPPGI